MSDFFDKSFAGGEFFKHKEREDGTRELFFGIPGADTKGHLVLGPKGNLKFLRESDGRKVADDSFDPDTQSWPK